MKRVHADEKRDTQNTLTCDTRSEEMSQHLRVFGGDALPVGRPDFKSGEGRETVLGGFDSYLLRQTNLEACR